MATVKKYIAYGVLSFLAIFFAYNAVATVAGPFLSDNDTQDSTEMASAEEVDFYDAFGVFLNDVKSYELWYLKMSSEPSLASEMLVEDLEESTANLQNASTENVDPDVASDAESMARDMAYILDHISDGYLYTRVEDRGDENFADVQVKTQQAFLRLQKRLGENEEYRN